MKNLLSNLWDFLVRFRTWLVNLLTAVVVALPFIINMPEFQAVLPPEALPWVLLVNAVLNLWMRPRPAVRARDPEAEITRLRKGDGDIDQAGV